MSNHFCSKPYYLNIILSHGYEKDDTNVYHKLNGNCKDHNNYGVYEYHNNAEH